MTTVAGHSFNALGACTGIVVRDDGTSCVCGRKLVDILQCDTGYVGERGWAHVDTLTHTEALQCVAEKERIARVSNAATHEVSA